MEFIEAELKREIEDALLQHPKIQSINSFVLSRNSNSITVEMEVYMSDAGANIITVTV